MNNIQQLLQQYCSDGVEWKTLGKSLVRTKGTAITASKMKELHKEGAPLKVFAGGKTIAFVNFEDIPQKDINKEPSIIVKSRGIIEFDYYDKPFTHKNEMWSYHSKNKYLNIKFVYYFLKINEPYFQNIGNKMQMPQISTPDTDNFLIPIICPNNPEKSLEIQTEIVRILDKFTSLTAELQAELQARKSQYEYYRNQLLDYPMGESDQLSLRSSRSDSPIQKDGNSAPQTSAPNPQAGNSVLQQCHKVEWKTLDHLAENLDYMRKPVASGSRDGGEIPYYGASGVVDYVKDYIFDGDYLLISEDGANLIARNTPIAFSISGKSWVNNHAHILKFNTYYDRRYVEYYLNSIDLAPYISGITQPKLNQKNLNSIKIPDTSPEEKARIVAILDKFDTLTNSISEGLPKEIELRQKQYEYYRDMLLTFPK